MPRVANTNATGKCTIITCSGWPTSATAEPTSSRSSSSWTSLLGGVLGLARVRHVVVLQRRWHRSHRHLSALRAAIQTGCVAMLCGLRRAAVDARSPRSVDELDRHAVVGDAGRCRRALRAGHGHLRAGDPATGLGLERIARALDRARRPRAAGRRPAAAHRLCVGRGRAAAAAAGKRAAADRGRGPAVGLDLPLSRPGRRDRRRTSCTCPRARRSTSWSPARTSSTPSGCPGSPARSTRSPGV